MSLKSMFVRTFLFLFGAKVFSKMLLQSEQSKAYRVFCEKVYGRDLCQANMVDEEQLQKLISAGKFTSSEKILDLGCGLGFTSEYLSDVTGADIRGVDFAKGAIESAQVRTALKKDRLEFVVGNLNKLPSSSEKYDVILAIDTLYFVNDLQSTILRLKALLNTGGRLLIFYSDKSDGVKKAATENDLGVSLSNVGFKFETWDFTQNEKQIWQSTLQAADELRRDFVKEGNADLFKSRRQEAVRNLRWQEEGLMTRYLYLAWCPETSVEPDIDVSF